MSPVGISLSELESGCLRVAQRFGSPAERRSAIGASAVDAKRGHQLTGLDPEDAREPDDAHEGWVAFAALDGSDVGAVKSRLGRKRLLRKGAR